ncbi:amidohydrolase [Acidobacteriota bacterium]
MKKTAICLVIFLVLGFVFFNCQTQEKADFVLKNGKVFTVSEKNPEVQAVAVKQGKIFAVGTNENIEKFIGPSTQTLDVQGKLVLPGFNEAHCHFLYGGQRLDMLSLGGADTVEKIQQKIAERIKELPEGTPVFGVGSFPSTAIFPGLGWPTKEMLDKVSPNNPVVIGRGGGHAVWLNSMSLKQSEITRNTEAPLGGEVVKDPQTGEPSGILKEAAQRLLKVERQSTPKQDIERAVLHTTQLGITSATTHANLESLDIYKELNKEGKLTLRIYATLPFNGLDEFIEKGIKRGQGDEMVRVGFLKAFIDGTIGVRTALMFEDFSEEPGNKGLAQYEEEEFYEMVAKAHMNDFPVGVHAIGDKGVNWVLNAVEKAQLKHGKKGLRHRVEHNTVILMEDTKRFNELGVIGSMQPNITGNQAYRERRLGKERAHRVDMWRTLLDNGAMLCWGTDWPVSTINPMFNLYQIVTRYPEQRLSMAEAIKYYTFGPAYGSFEEDIKGTLEKGKLADMVVLSQDLFTIDPEDITKTEVLYTILGGKIVHQK